MTEIIKSENKIINRKAHVAEYNKKYYKEHRNYWFDDHKCLCGSTYNMSHKSRHQGSNKHKKFMENYNKTNEI